MEFKYEILAINEETRHMEVLFTKEGSMPLMVGTRIPFQNEKLEDVLMMYAPISRWEELNKTLNPPVVGTKGTLVYVEYVPPTVESRSNIVVGAQTL